MSREQIYGFYWIIFIISAWATAFSWMALILSRSRLWMVITLSKTALCLVLAGLVIQRSPLATPEINQAILWMQRAALLASSIGSVAMVYYMLNLSNGAMASVRRAFILPWLPVVCAYRKLATKGAICEFED